MMETSELYALARALSQRKVLSIYLDNRVTDPSRRHAWRAALVTELRSARQTITDADERAAFDRAAAFLDRPVPLPGGMWGAPGWVAFATADGPAFIGELPRRTETIVAWRDGPAVAPYLRALKQHRPVIVALVQSRLVKLHRYAHASLEPLEDVGVAQSTAASAVGRSSFERAGRGYPAPRSAVTTEIAQRRQAAAFDRLAPTLAARLTLLAGADGLIVFGGAPEWSRLASEALPRALQDRIVVSPTLSHDASPDEIVRAAKRAARQLRARRGRAIVSHTLGRVGHRAVAGVPALQRALHLRAVDLLLLTPRFLQLERNRAEDLLWAALSQGADVEVLSGEPATLLDGTAGGVAARLRFAIDRPLESTRHTAAAQPTSPAAS
jgi:hypothetical protein